MALTITDEGNGTSGSSSATVVTGSTIDAAVGDWLVAKVAADNAGTNGAASLSSVSDSQGNTWTQRAIVTNDPGAANAGCTVGIFTAAITNALSGGTVTANFSPNTTVKVLQVYRVEPGSGETIQHIASDSTGVTGVNNAPVTNTVSVTNGDAIFAAIAAEARHTALTTLTGDSDTTDGSWSSLIVRNVDSGQPFTSMLVGSQYKTVTGTGNQTWNGSFANAVDWATSYVVLRSAAANKELDADAGSYTVTGQPASLEYGRKVAADSGSYAISGQTASLERGYEVEALAGSYAINGQVASLIAIRHITAEAGGYTISGQPASLEYGRLLAAQSGAYIITGSDADLIIDGDKTLLAEGGAYSITGQAASLERGYRLTAEAGSYALNGSPAGLFVGREVAAQAGSYSINGQAVDLRVTRFITAISGSYVINGSPATLFRALEIEAASGSYLIAGADVVLHILHGPGRARVTISGARASVSGSSAKGSVTGAGIRSTVSASGPRSRVTASPAKASTTVH